MADTADQARTTIAEWFDSQGRSCAGLGSPLYTALLPAVADHVRDGRYDSMLAPLDGWRFGDAMPLRVMSAAHSLALSGAAPELATVYPSCGGVVPNPIPGTDLADAVFDALAAGANVAADYLHRAVQTNETGRAAALVLGLSALAGPLASDTPISLLEVGASAGLNLRLDRFAYLDGGGLIDAGGLIDDDVVLLGGDAGSPVRLAPEWRPTAPTLSPWTVGERVGLDPHPADPTRPEVALRLRSYLWPDQTARRIRLNGAIKLAGQVPADLIETDDTAATLKQLLGERAGNRPTLVFQSIMWQYVPTADRWGITRAIESAGERATELNPLVRVTFEPDEFRRDRVAVQARRWPGGSGTLLAHADYHGRWVEPLPGTPRGPVSNPDSTSKAAAGR